MANAPRRVEPRNSMFKTTKLFAPLLALALVAAACGGSSKTNATVGTEAPASITPTTASADIELPSVEVATTASPTTEADISSVVVPTSAIDGTARLGATTTSAPRLGTAAANNPTVLAAVSTSATSAQTVWTEQFLEIEISGDGEDMVMGSATEPVMTSVTSGDRFQMRMDMAAMLGTLASELGSELGDDLTIDYVGDDSVVYLRSSFLGSMAGAADPMLGGLSDGWGVIYLADIEAALGDLVPEDLLAAISGQDAQSVDQWYDMILASYLLSDGVESSVRGITTTRYEANLSFNDLMAAGGMDDLIVDMLAAQGGTAEESENVTAIFDAMTFDLTIDIDDDERLRQIVMDMDMDALFEALSTYGEPAPDDLRMVMRSTIVFTDYSDDLVDIQFPSDDEVTVDLGLWMQDLLEFGAM